MLYRTGRKDPACHSRAGTGHRRDVRQDRHRLKHEHRFGTRNRYGGLSGHGFDDGFGNLSGCESHGVVGGSGRRDHYAEDGQKRPVHFQTAGKYDRQAKDTVPAKRPRSGIHRSDTRAAIGCLQRIRSHQRTGDLRLQHHLPGQIYGDGNERRNSGCGGRPPHASSVLSFRHMEL